MRRIIIGLAPALIVMSGSAIAATPAWRVSEVSGEVRLTEDGRSRAAVKGALLSSGATIATGARARAVIVRGEEFVVISPKSQLRLPAADTQNKIMQIIEDFGTAVFKINRKSTLHFGVKTPYLAAVVKGTTFTVTVGQEGSSVQVTEGAVEVSTLDGGAADLITPGNIAMVGASDLYQLTVEGAVNKVLRSDQPAGQGGVTSGVTPAAYVGPAAPAVQIASPLAENPLSLSSVTDGLIDGSAAMELAAVEFADQTRASIIESPLQPPPVEPDLPLVEEPAPPPAAEPEPEPEPEPMPEPEPVPMPEPGDDVDDGKPDTPDKPDDKDDDPDDGDNGDGNDDRDEDEGRGDDDDGDDRGGDDDDRGGDDDDDDDDRGGDDDEDDGDGDGDDDD